MKAAWTKVGFVAAELSVGRPVRARGIGTWPFEDRGKVRFAVYRVGGPQARMLATADNAYDAAVVFVRELERKN